MSRANTLGMLFGGWLVLIDPGTGEYELFILGPANRGHRRSACGWTVRVLREHGYAPSRNAVWETFHAAH